MTRSTNQKNKAREKSRVAASDTENVDAETLELLADTLSPVVPAQSVRTRLLSSAVLPGRLNRFASRVAALLGISVESAGALLDRAQTRSGWMPIADRTEIQILVNSSIKAIPGAQTLSVSHGLPAGSIAAFARMRPGALFPEHEHFGRERSLIIQGVCVDQCDGGDDVVRRPDDELFKERGSSHSIRALDGPDLLFLAVVEHGFRMGDVVIGSDPGQ